MTCSHCGGSILGDGYTEVFHCENVDITDYSDTECDSAVIECQSEG